MVLQNLDQPLAKLACVSWATGGDELPVDHHLLALELRSRCQERLPFRWEDSRSPPASTPARAKMTGATQMAPTSFPARLISTAKW